MEDPLDATTLSTLTLMESRMLRIEHLLYGHKATAEFSQEKSALLRLGQLERRFSTLLSDFRVYGELLKIYKANPDFFHAPDPSQPPSQLSPDELQAIVLASAPSYPAILSSLTAVNDCPIPDPSDSASIIALTDRMKAMEAVQLAQTAEVAGLRKRSELLVRAWFEGGMLQGSKSMADLEGRVEKVERGIRRREHQVEQENEGL